MFTLTLAWVGAIYLMEDLCRLLLRSLGYLQ